MSQALLSLKSAKTGKIKNIVLVLFLSLLINSTIQGQNFEVPLDLKITASELVIEGEVVESECFRIADGDIYTAHTIRIYKSFKNAPTGNTLSIITRGGILDGEEETWTHLLTLNKGERGIFFLRESRPESKPVDRQNEEYFSVFSSSQGFLKYDYRNNSVRAYEMFHQYDDVQKELFGKLEQKYNKSYQNFAGNDWSYEKWQPEVLYSYTTQTKDDGRCLDFLFEILSPDLNNPLLITTIVSIKASEITKITKPVIVTRYNTSALGSNIYANGLVTLEQIGISADVNYSSIIEDFAPDKVKIEINANSLNEPDLYVITTNYTPLIKINLTLPGYVDPGILIDQETMENLSKYFDISEQIEKYFDCMRVEGDFQAYACPIALITGFSSASVESDTIIIPNNDFNVAGTDNLLLITGVCFGETQGDSYVEFTNAKTGPNQDEWVQPLDADYVTWSNEEILVYIPTIPNDTTNFSWYAGSGPVRVHVDGVGTSTSSNEVLVRFAISNKKYDGHEAPVPQHTLLVNLVDRNNEGGYSLVYFPNFIETDGAIDAFERALLKWQCLTNVNYTIKDSSDIPVGQTPCLIKFDDLPVGVGGATLAVTSRYTSACYDFSPDSIRFFSFMTRFNMSFNENLDWYMDEDTSIDISLDDLIDLESRALHELGHSLQLKHVNNPDDLMYYTDVSEPTYFNREILQNDGFGGILTVDNAFDAPAPSCAPFGTSAMISYQADGCISNSVENHFLLDCNYSISPNPTYGEFYVYSKVESLTDNKYFVYNSIGELVSSDKINQIKQGINIVNQPNGIYIIKIVNSTGEIESFKLIKN